MMNAHVNQSIRHGSKPSDKPPMLIEFAHGTLYDASEDWL